jgi:hypothetical protein
LLTDVLSMWKNTTNFVRVQEFKNVESGPIEVVARELASCTINKSKWEKFTSKDSVVKAEPTTKNDDNNADKNNTNIDTNENTTIKQEDSGALMDMAEVASTEPEPEPVGRKTGRAPKRARSSGGEGAKRSRVSRTPRSSRENVVSIPFHCNIIYNIICLFGCVCSSSDIRRSWQSRDDRVRPQ